jgi:hypothetical protein
MAALKPGVEKTLTHHGEWSRKGLRCQFEKLYVRASRPESPPCLGRQDPLNSRGGRHDEDTGRLQQACNPANGRIQFVPGEKRRNVPQYEHCVIGLWKAL